MKKIVSKDENIINILKQLTKRIEEATIDIHEMKRDMKFINLKLNSVDHNSGIIKVDVEKTREDVKDLINMISEILAKMVTQKELQSLSQRVASLEQ